jgi:branched-chain amino acid transport system permease protein
MLDYVFHLLFLIVIYCMLAQSLNLAAGFVGLISLTHAGFYAVGAYTTAILSERVASSFWINLPIAMILSGTIAFLVSLITLRTVEDYFVICTLGIQVILLSIMNNWTSVTHGPIGISGIPSISLFGVSIHDRFGLFLLSALIASTTYYLLRNITSSGFGNTLRAIREDEIFAQSVGKDVYKYKVISFTLAAVVAAIPGTLYAHYVSYIDPSSFTVGESIFILSIAIVGGLGNLKGSLYAAIFFILLPEALRFLGMPNNIAANVRQIIYGFLLVLIIVRQGKQQSMITARENSIRRSADVSP